MLQFLERIILIGVCLLAIVIGAGITMLVTKAIEQTKFEVCFENKSLEFCEEK